MDLRSGGSAVLSVMAPGRSGPAAAAANLPVGSLAATLATQGDYGTIKGRLVWGGSDVPPARTLVEKGRGTKGSRGLRTGGGNPHRELVVDPKTKGVAYGFAYLVKPKGTNPEAVKELLATQPESRSSTRRIASSCPMSWRSIRIRRW